MVMNVKASEGQGYKSTYMDCLRRGIFVRCRRFSIESAGSTAYTLLLLAHRVVLV